jgi:hypothetical protein
MGPPKFGSRPASERGSNNDCRNSGRGLWRSPRRRVHPHLPLGHNVAKVDPDAKSDAALLRHRRIAISHPALNLGRASHRNDNAGEFRQQAIACGFDDAPAMPGDLQVDQLSQEQPISRCWIPVRMSGSSQPDGPLTE